MQFWLGLVLGLIIGWIIEWIIDWWYWRGGSGGSALSTSYGSDLTRITGINSDYDGRLKASGISTVASLAGASPSAVRSAIGGSDGKSIDAEAWIVEAGGLSGKAGAGSSGTPNLATSLASGGAGASSGAAASGGAGASAGKGSGASAGGSGSKGSGASAGSSGAAGSGAGSSAGKGAGSGSGSSGPSARAGAATSGASGGGTGSGAGSSAGKGTGSAGASTGTGSGASAGSGASGSAGKGSSAGSAPAKSSPAKSSAPSSAASGSGSRTAESGSGSAGSGSGDRKDNLTKIHGVGKVFQGKFYDAGITTWEGVSKLSDAEIRKIIEPKEWQKIETDVWIEEARILAGGGVARGGSAKGGSGRGDDLTKIHGVGKVYQGKFHDADVYLWSEVAALSDERILEIIDPEEWQKIEPEEWKAEARQFAAEKGGDA